MFRCKKCKVESAPTDNLNSTQVHVGEDTFEAVPTIQYLGDMIEESGGCVDATSARITAAWKDFRQLLPIIINRGILLKNRGNLFGSCIRKGLLYGCETWPVYSETLRRLTFADNGLVRWICGVRLEQRIRTQKLHDNLGTKKKITKNLKDLNIRKELADERVEWLRAIMPRKIQLQRVRFICGGQAL